MPRLDRSPPQQNEPLQAGDGIGEPGLVLFVELGGGKPPLGHGQERLSAPRREREFKVDVEALEAVRHYARSAAAHGMAERLGPARRSSLVPDLAPPAPAHGVPEDPMTRRYLRFEAVAALLSEAVRREPVLLVLDDLHWADGSTLQLLRHVAQLDGASRPRRAPAPPRSGCHDCATARPSRSVAA